MTHEEKQGGAAEAFEAMRGELASLRRALEGRVAERGAIDLPHYTETLERTQRGVDAPVDRKSVSNDVIARSRVLAITPEQMSHRIAAAGEAARREDREALAEAGEDKARVMTELRVIARSAWTWADQRIRQLLFGLGGMLIDVLAWAMVPGLFARELAPTSWQWPESMAARTLVMRHRTAGQRMMQSIDPAQFRAINTRDKIMAANRGMEQGCGKVA